MSSKASHILKSIFLGLFLFMFVSSCLALSGFSNIDVYPKEETTTSFSATVKDIYISKTLQGGEGTAPIEYYIETNEFDDVITVQTIMIADLEAMDTLHSGDKITFWIEDYNLNQDGSIASMNVVQLKFGEDYIVTFESYGDCLMPVITLTKNVLIASTVILGLLSVLFMVLVVKSRKHLNSEKSKQVYEKSENAKKQVNIKNNTQKLGIGDFDTELEEDDISNLNIRFSLCRKEISRAAAKFYFRKDLIQTILFAMFLVGGIVCAVLSGTLNFAYGQTSNILLCVGIFLVNIGAAYFLIKVSEIFKVISGADANEEGKNTFRVVFGSSVKIVNYNKKTVVYFEYPNIKASYEFRDFFVIECDGQVLIISKESLSMGNSLKIRELLSKNTRKFRLFKED